MKILFTILLFFVPNISFAIDEDVYIADFFIEESDFIMFDEELCDINDPDCEFFVDDGGIDPTVPEPITVMLAFIATMAILLHRRR